MPTPTIPPTNNPSTKFLGTLGEIGIALTVASEITVTFSTFMILTMLVWKVDAISFAMVAASIGLVVVTVKENTCESAFELMETMSANCPTV